MAESTLGPCCRAPNVLHREIVTPWSCLGPRTLKVYWHTPFDIETRNHHFRQRLFEPSIFEIVIEGMIESLRGILLLKKISNPDHPMPDGPSKNLRAPKLIQPNEILCRMSGHAIPSRLS